MISIWCRQLIGILSIVSVFFTISIRNSVFISSQFIEKMKSFPTEVKLIPYSIGSILSFLIVINGWNWSLFVFVFLMLNVWHLSTWMIKLAQVVHLIKTLHKSWLSLPNAVTVAVSANWNQYFGDKQSWDTYPVHSTFSDLMVLIKELTIRFNSKGNRLSP